jgi:arsenate reductase
VKKKVLFLCTGNSARSQMAEALAREDHGDVLEPVSAGSRPGGFVHPLAIRAIEELGMSMDGAYSKSADGFLDRDFDAVVTVCDSAARDCPFWPGAKRIEHWPIVDPSFGPDDPATRYERFVATRDELRRRIDRLAASFAKESPGRSPDR